MAGHRLGLVVGREEEKKRTPTRLGAAAGAAAAAAISSPGGGGGGGEEEEEDEQFSSSTSSLSAGEGLATALRKSKTALMPLTKTLQVVANAPIFGGNGRNNRRNSRSKIDGDGRPAVGSSLATFLLEMSKVNGVPGIVELMRAFKDDAQVCVCVCVCVCVLRVSSYLLLHLISSLSIDSVPAVCFCTNHKP